MSTNRLIKEEIYFHGGLDTDSDEKFIRQGDYVDALNIVSVEDGQGGIRVNIKGNKSMYTKPAGYTSEYLCGWTFYDKNESIILFLYAIDGGSPVYRIIEYIPTPVSSVVIIEDSDLLFYNPSTTDYFIKADMIGDWLAWTDNINPPRMVNIYNILNDSPPPVINAAYLDLIKIPPLSPPIPRIGRDTTKIINNIDKSFQFKYRYVYNDYRKSVYSSGSDIVVNRKFVLGADFHTMSSLDNYIEVQFNSGNANIRYIEIVTRTNNNGIWNKIIRIDKDDPENTYNAAGVLQTSLTDELPYYYRFFNDGLYFAITNEEAFKPYDTVPEKSESLCFIGDNRLTLGGNTEGKNLPIEVNPNLTATYLSPPSIFFNWSRTETSSYPSVVYEIVFDWDDIGRTEVLAGDYVYFKFSGSVNHDGGTPLTYALNTYTVFDDNYTSISDILDYLRDNTELPSETGYTAGSWSIIHVQAYNQLWFRYTAAAGEFTSKNATDNYTLVFNRAYSLTQADTDQGFSRSKMHKFALIYRDSKGRKYPALTASETSLLIKGKGESGVGDGVAYVSYTLGTMYAPSDAVSYRWAYAYTPPIFVQTICHNVSHFEDADGNINTNLLALDVGARGNINYNYTFEKGDYLKVLMDGGSYSAPSGYLSSVREYEVLDVVLGSINDGSSDPDIVGTWLIIKPTNEDGYDYDSVGVVSKFFNSLVEVYKKTPVQSESVFYEIGNGGTCVGGTTTHTPSSGYLSEGDIWYRPVMLYKQIDTNPANITSSAFMVEDPYPWNGYANKVVGAADPNVEYPDSISKYDNTIRWSNKFFQDTQVNGLSTFDFNDRIDVADNHGNIKGIEELGQSLVVICEEKVLSAYVGATEYTDTQGNVNIVKSTSPIGYLRPHAEKYGTFLKESIINNGKYIYFFDLFNGAVIRKSANGLFPISGRIDTAQGSHDYKMRTFFKDLSDELIIRLHLYTPTRYYNVKCFMGYDPYYENIYITFLDRVNTDNNVSLIFNESSNRWISKYTGYEEGVLRTTFFPFTKNYFYSFQESVGKLYQQNNESSFRCQLYETVRDSYIQFVSHEAPNIVKIFNTIAVHADAEYVVDPIEIDSNSSYNYGMQTKILSTDWIKEEGVWKASMPKNMKTRSSLATNYDRINGEEMKGNVLKIKMTNSDTDKISLFKVDLTSELSR